MIRHPQTLAFTAMPLDALLPVNYLQESSFEGMTALAVGFPGIDGTWELASDEVCNVCHWFHMGSILATADAAQVIDNQSVRDRANKEFIGEPMGTHNAATSRFAAIPETPITIVIKKTQPQPAWPQLWSVTRQRPILIDPLPEPLFRGNETLIVGIVSHAKDTTTATRVTQGGY